MDGLTLEVVSGNGWPGSAFGKARPKADTRLTARAAATAYRGRVELVLPARNRRCAECT